MSYYVCIVNIGIYANYTIGNRSLKDSLPKKKMGLLEKQWVN